MLTIDTRKLSIVHYPNPVLRKACQPVPEFGSKVRVLASRMLELMHAEKGIGLAAPQVGVAVRLFVCNITGEPQDDLICVNPNILERSGWGENEEGCLSLPGVTVTMRRATRVVMEVFDEDGARAEQTGEDLLGRVWQHEMDHLEGRLIIDDMSTSDEIANRRVIKQLKEDYASVGR